MANAEDRIRREVRKYPGRVYRYAVYWLQTVIYQGTRLLASRDVSIPLEEFGVATKFQPVVAEWQFILTALGKAIRWVEKVKLIGDDDLEKPIQDFTSAMSGMKTIHDIWEHDDEYLLFEGRYPDEMHKESPVPGMKMSLSVTSPIWWGFKDGAEAKCQLSGGMEARDIIERSRCLALQILKVWEARKCTANGKQAIRSKQ